MRKTYKYRIYANREVLGKADNWLFLCRRLYNSALEQRITIYRQNKDSISCYSQINQLPELKASFRDYALNKGNDEKYNVPKGKLLVFFKQVRQFITHHMKYVMIAIFTVNMGYSAYIFGNLTTEQLTGKQELLNWIWFTILILVAILSIVYASILGHKEDKEKRRKIQLEIENLELEKMYRETPGII